jgi:dihydrofolate reductase
MIIGIVAIARNYSIGKDGKLPWHYPADLKFFKETTTGNAIVMGANTWRSIGKPLPGRLNIVLSRSGVEPLTDALRLASINEVLTLSKYLDSDTYIIGGAKTFTAFADVIDKWLVTEVPLEVEDADVFMPSDFLSGFEQANKHQLSDSLVVKTYIKKAEMVFAK